MFNFFNRKSDIKILALELKVLELESALRKFQSPNETKVLGNSTVSGKAYEDTMAVTQKVVKERPSYIGKPRGYESKTSHRLYGESDCSGATWKKCEGFRPTRAMTIVRVQYQDMTRYTGPAHSIDWRIVTHWQYPQKYYR